MSSCQYLSPLDWIAVGFTIVAVAAAVLGVLLADSIRRIRATGRRVSVREVFQTLGQHLLHVAVGFLVLALGFLVVANVSFKGVPTDRVPVPWKGLTIAGLTATFLALLLADWIRRSGEAGRRFSVRAIVNYLDQHLLHVTIGLLVAVFVLLAFANRIIVTIPAGHAGVLWKRFAGGTQHVGYPPPDIACYGEGLQVIWPWDKMTLYDLRFRIIEREYVAVDKRGLRLDLKVATRFRVRPGRESLLHKFIGVDYVEIVVAPEVGDHTRAVVSNYTAEEVYSSRRDEIEKKVRARVRQEISVRGAGENPEFDLIDVEDILLHDISLPPMVARAIEEKMRQSHMIEEWGFRIEREAKEAARKEIEADGIRLFQEKVSQGISEPLLRWKGIDATLKLAESPNTKIVIFGSSPHGLPLILGGEAAPLPTRPAGPAPRADVPAETHVARPAESDTPAAPQPAPPPPTAETAARKIPPKGRTGEGKAPAESPSGANAPAPAASSGGIRGFLNRLLGLER